MLNLIRRNLGAFRLLLVVTLSGLWFVHDIGKGSVAAVLLFVGIGKAYETFFLRGGQKWDADPVSLKLMIPSKIADYIWNGFR